MRSSTCVALFALLPVLLAAPVPIRRASLLDGLFGHSDDGAGLLGLGKSGGPLGSTASLPVLGSANPVDPSSLGIIPTGNSGPLGMLDSAGSPTSSLPILGSGPADPSSLGIIPTGSDGPLSSLLSPLTSALDPATSVLGDALDLVLPTKLICADVGALLTDIADLGICACIGLGEKQDGLWFGREQGPLGGLAVGTKLVAGLQLDAIKDTIHQTGREVTYPAHTLPRCDGSGGFYCPTQYQRDDGTCGPKDGDDEDYPFPGAFRPVRPSPTTTSPSATSTPTESSTPVTEEPTPSSEPTPTESPTPVAEEPSPSAQPTPADESTPATAEPTPAPETTPAPDATTEPAAEDTPEPASEVTPTEPAEPEVVAEAAPAPETPPSAEPTSAPEPAATPAEASPSPSTEPAANSAAPTPLPSAEASDAEPADAAAASESEPAPASEDEPISINSVPTDDGENHPYDPSIDGADAEQAPTATATITAMATETQTVVETTTAARSEVMTVITVPVTVDIVTITITDTVTSTPPPATITQTATTTETVHDCASPAPTVLSIAAIPSESTPTPSSSVSFEPTPTPTPTPTSTESEPIADPTGAFRVGRPVPRPMCPEGQEFKETMCCRKDQHEVDGQCKCLPGMLNNLSLDVCVDLDLCFGQVLDGECVLGNLELGKSLPLGLGSML